MTASPEMAVSSAEQTLDFDSLVLLLEQIFVRHGTSAEVARTLALNCAGAERDGAHSHGVFRIPGYVSTLQSGWVNGQAVPVVEDVASGFVRVDAGNGFAQPALAAARPLLIEKARSAGIALPLTAAVTELVKELVAQGHGDLDHSALYLLATESNGLSA